MNLSNKELPADLICLQVELDRITNLFNQGDLQADDVYCLHCASETCVWNLCLACTATQMKILSNDKHKFVHCEKSAERLGQRLPIQIGIKQQSAVLC